MAVELLFDKPTAAWVRDRLWHPSQRLEPLPGRRLRMTLRVAVIRPDTLRQQVAADGGVVPVSAAATPWPN